MPQIKNLKKAAERILKAIKRKERIILYGDADLDGISSVIILKETINSLGGKVSAVYFPDREIEGYGITEIGLRDLKKHTPALLIAVDCGIGNFKEVKLAKKLGFEVIIVEHHEVLDRLPQAEIIVNPKTMKRCDFNSPEGRDLLNKYMTKHFQEYLNRTKDDWNYYIITLTMTLMAFVTGFALGWKIR